MGSTLNLPDQLEIEEQSYVAVDAPLCRTPNGSAIQNRGTSDRTWAIVIIEAVFQTIISGSLSPKIAKVLAVGLIEALDVFLIAVVAQIIGLGLYVLFIDDTLPLPAWLKISNLDDLKSHLVSSVIAVLAVLFMREAVAWDGQRDLLGFGVAPDRDRRPLPAPRNEATVRSGRNAGAAAGRARSQGRRAPSASECRTASTPRSSHSGRRP
jgi:Uncharacterized protein family, UPF0114